MTLCDWIEKTGPKKVAQSLGVDPSTVSHWRLGNKLPRPAYMVKINRLSKGKVSYKAMIENFVSHN